MSEINADEAIDFGTFLVDAGRAAKAAGNSTFDLSGEAEAKYKAARAEAQQALDQATD